MPADLEPLYAEQVAEASTLYATKRANDLDGATWTRYSISIWSDLRKTPEEAALKHPAMFPMALPARLIECFTRRGMTVLDPFTRWDAHTKSLDAASFIPAGEL